MASLFLLALSLSLTLAQLALPIRINCGGGAFTDLSGNAWLADNFFVAGSRIHVDTSTTRIRNVDNPTDLTTDETLYKNERFGPVAYNIPVDPGTYNVQFHLAEVWPPNEVTGARVFAISIENTEVFSSVDIFALSGASTAMTLRPVSVTVQDNILSITTRPIRENPKLNGIVITRASGGPPPPPPPPSNQRPVFTSTAPTNRQALLNRPWTYQATTSNSNGVTFSLVTSPTLGSSVISSSRGEFSFTPVSDQASTSQSFTIRATNSAGTTDQSFTVRVDDSYYRINCGGTEVVDSTGKVWLDDSRVGSVWANNNGVIFTDFSADIIHLADFPLSVLQSSRWDRDDGAANELNFRLSLPSNVRVDVDVIFAEIWLGANVANRRIFSVSAEGTTIANNLDLTSMFGFRTQGIRSATNLLVTDGELNIVFTHGSQNNPTVNAIRVKAHSGSNPPSGGCNGGQVACGSTCCPSGQTCQNDRCATPSACNSPFVTQNGKCVFPITPAGLCPRNEVDCRIGCASQGTQNNPATVCQGGVCEDGVCVPVAPSARQISDLRQQIRAFTRAKIDDELANGDVDRGPKRVGDFVGGVVRSLFHDAGASRAARGCLFVRDLDTGSCNGQACEFTADHNKGLSTVVQEIHAFYNSLNIWWQINLPDFFYLFVSEVVNLVSDGRGVVPVRFGRQPCRCLLTRPFSACTSPPSFPDSMPDPEMSLFDLRRIMQTEMGFTEHEWFCLLGCHSLGRAMRNNTGYARNWSPTPATLDNTYYLTMNNDPWIREAGEASSSVDVPASGKNQFQIGTAGLGRHQGQMMLKADMVPYWDIEGSNCDVTHGATSNFCQPRSPQFDFLQQLLNINFFFSCLNPALQKLSELGTSGLFLARP